MSRLQGLAANLTKSQGYNQTMIDISTKQRYLRRLFITRDMDLLHETTAYYRVHDEYKLPGVVIWELGQQEGCNADPL